MSLSLQINEVLRQFGQTSTYGHVNDSKTDHPRCQKLDLRKADFIVPNARKTHGKEGESLGEHAQGHLGTLKSNACSLCLSSLG